MNTMTEQSTVRVMGVPVFDGNRQEVLERVVNWLSSSESVRVVLTPTTEQVVMASEEGVGESPGLSDCFERADLNVADAAGVVWSMRRHGAKRVERYPGVDMMQDIFSEAMERSKKVFFLGGRKDIAEKAAKALKEAYAITDEDFGKLVRWDQGSSDVASELEKEALVMVKKINDFEADVLFVAYGAPFQERWVTAIRGRLRVKVAMVVGGALDMVAGKVRRAPLWWRKIGLEWLWRLLYEPWRWRRQLRLLRFVGRELAGRRDGSYR
jgi:N-acetylglucosaminyldiphosphoundecaprenol N-acetyl-beta-D-mannosaminyltransferase